MEPQTSKSMDASRWIGVFVAGSYKLLALFSDEYGLEASHYAVLWAHAHLRDYEIREVTLGQTGMRCSDPFPPVTVTLLPEDLEFTGVLFDPPTRRRK